MDKPSSSSTPGGALCQYIEALEVVLGGIHGFITGAPGPPRALGRWRDAREAFSHVEAQVEREGERHGVR